MPKPGKPGSGWRWSAVFFLTVFLVVSLDQLTKIWIRSILPVGQSKFEVGFFRLTHVHNTGAAFGLFQGQSLPLTIVASIGVAAILVCAYFIYFRSSLDSRLIKSILGLILGGTVGNLIDRLRFGYVTDFIDFTVWPTFNLADSVVTIGVILFAYSLLRLAQAGKHQDGENVQVCR